MSPRLSVALVALALASSGCALSEVAVDRQRASEAWEGGHRQRALGISQETYARFRQANGLEETHIRQAAQAAIEHLESHPIPPSQEGPRVPEGPLSLGASEPLDAAIRADLMSPEATACLRAIHGVAAMKMSQHAPGLLAVIFREDPWTPDPGPLERADPAETALVLKHLALEALTALVMTSQGL